MFLDTLIICESEPSVKEIRLIQFKNGLNIIMDDSEIRGNSVGKTTALRIIDLCLGAKDKKYLYTDAETGGENTTLKSYINSKKVFAELTLIDEFDREEQEKVTLRVDLFNKGSRYINSEKKTLEEYNKCLNKILFDNEEKTPSFRQLIPKFVRVSQRGDTDKFLKYLHQTTKNAEYRNIYSYFFGLIDNKLNDRILKIQKEISESEASITNFKKIHHFKNISELAQLLEAQKKAIETINEKLSALIDSEAYKLTEREISNIRIEYTKLLDQLDKLKFEKQKVDMILSAIGEDDRVVDVNLLTNLYDETKENFGANELKKDFLALVIFNEELQKNKKKFYISQLEKKENDIQTVQEKIKEVYDKNKDVILLLQNNKMDEYASLQGALLKYQEEKGRTLEIKEVYERLIEELEVHKENLREIDVDGKTIEEKISDFNHFFTDYSKKIAGENYFIFYNVDGFPFGVGNVDGGLSTGAKKTIISSFDLAYFQYTQDKDIKAPKFIIHDVLESMDGQSFENMVNIINGSNVQYIVAVLREKIKDYKVIKDTDIRLKLSKDNKLFYV